MSKIENLFICMTPLQMVIARRIIEDKQLKHVGFIIVFYNENPKYRFYIDNLKAENYFTIEYRVSSQGKFGRLMDVLKLKLFLRQAKLHTQNIYLASIDNALIHTVLSKINFQNLYTFDDGLANLNYHGQYYFDTESYVQKLIKLIMGTSWSLASIKSVSKEHFSLYEHKKNIIPNVTYLKLFRKKLNHQFTLNNQNNLKIFIGQPLLDINPYFSTDFIQSSLNNLGIDFYFPHPRETNLPFKIKYINSNQILEDFYIQSYETSNISLYTFLSTSILHIKEINPDCNVYVLYNAYLLTKYHDIYKIFLDKNITMIKI